MSPRRGRIALARPRGCREIPPLGRRRGDKRGRRKRGQKGRGEAARAGDGVKMGSEKEGKRKKDGGVGFAASVGGTSVCSLGDKIERRRAEREGCFYRRRTRREKLPSPLRDAGGPSQHNFGRNRAAISLSKLFIQRTRTTAGATSSPSNSQKESACS